MNKIFTTVILFFLASFFASELYGQCCCRPGRCFSNRARAFCAPRVCQPVCHQMYRSQPTCCSVMVATCHQPICHQPICHQPVCHQPICHQPVYHQPVYPQPICRLPVLQQPAMIVQQPLNGFIGGHDISPLESSAGLQAQSGNQAMVAASDRCFDIDNLTICLENCETEFPNDELSRTKCEAECYMVFCPEDTCSNRPMFFNCARDNCSRFMMGRPEADPQKFRDCISNCRRNNCN